MRCGYDPSVSTTVWTTTPLLFADDELNTGIFGREPLYSDKGQPDTTLATDNVVDLGPAMRIRPDEAVCSARRSRPPGRPGSLGGPGGPGGRGRPLGMGKPEPAA